MTLDVHIAFLIAAFAVLGGLTYTVGQFLDKKTAQAKAKRLLRETASHNTGSLRV